jgi:aspartate kinase
MHSRSIEFAKKYGVPIHVRSSFSDAPGTWIVAERDARRLGASVTGAALLKDEARVTVTGVPDRPGTVHALFRPIAEANIVVDMIVQNISTEGHTEVSFTVAAGDLAETLRVAEAAARAIGASGVTHDANVAKVSVVGQGMEILTGVARTMFESLADVRVNIQMITTSEIKISVLIDRGAAVAALRAVHQAFELDREPVGGPEGVPVRPRDAASRRAETTEDGGVPRGMEDLVISDVVLDEDQARVTILTVPDQPGYAARVFRLVGDANVLVDMIVQNASDATGRTHLSFTVPRRETSHAAAALAELGEAVRIDPDLAKLSVLGVGMRSHTGVATRMFGALAERGINIALINTSEVRINVATKLDQGRTALECLRRAFLVENGA